MVIITERRTMMIQDQFIDWAIKIDFKHSLPLDIQLFFC